MSGAVINEKPSAEAMDAAQQFVDTLWNGYGYTSPEVDAFAKLLDTFAAVMVLIDREKAASDRIKYIAQCSPLW